MLFRYELYKFDRLPNYIFSIVGFGFLYLFSKASVDIASINHQLTNVSELFALINLEFCRNLLILVPTWYLFSVGAEFDDKIIQKSITCGFSRISIVFSKLIPFFLMLVTIIIVYLFCSIILVNHYLNLTENILSVISKGIFQISVVSIGYFGLSFLFLIFFKQTKTALLFFWLYVFVEIVATYFIQKNFILQPNKFLPLGIVRSLFVKGNGEYFFIDQVPFSQFAIYLLLIVVVFFSSVYFFNKKDLPNL